MSTDILSFLFESSIVFTVLYLSYRIVFKSFTFYKLNRFVLLSLVPLSLLLPFVHFELAFSEISLPAPESAEVYETFIPATFTDSPAVQAPTTWSWNSVILAVYLIGFSISAIGFFFKLYAIFKIKRSASPIAGSKPTLWLADVNEVCSSFNCIFIPKNECQEIHPKIIAHEEHHIRLKHTLDLLLSEAYAAIFWFNPLGFLYKRDIKNNHEFEVDAQFSQSEEESIAYLKLIHKHLIYKHKEQLLGHYFNSYTLKTRIHMMTKKNSAHWKKLTYLLLLPMIFFFSFSFTVLSPEAEIPSISPVRKGEIEKVSSGFGMRINPITKEETLHKGMDFIAKEGTEILATASGIVIEKAYKKNGYGKMIVIDHGNNCETRYTHMKDFNVEAGDHIHKGAVIGYVGSTGRSTRPHLHYEVRLNGEPVDPVPYLTRH